MTATALREQVRSALIHRFDVDFTLREKSPQDVAKTGLMAVDSLTGGIPLGAMTEIHGAVSSGRTSLLLSTLAQATKREEFCALVDGAGSFDPASSEALGMDLSRLLWVRCGGSAEHALKAADLLLQAGGFSIVAIDLGDLDIRDARRISLASWFRLRQAAEKGRAAFLVLGAELHAKSCSTLQLHLQRRQSHWRGRLFEGMNTYALAEKAGRGTDVRLSVRSR